MARTDIVVIDGTEYAFDEGKRCGRKNVESRMKYKDLKALNLDEIGNAFTVYIMDWYELTSAQQSEFGCQLIMFDAEDKRWLPQDSM